ncbi:hypothetical protein QQ054_16060 [Oscillatoria amoena NRMC-F 0135]|nr:hypothetical protein [Oscillatoria amoena NRMC-F 0135]
MKIDRLVLAAWRFKHFSLKGSGEQTGQAARAPQSLAEKMGRAWPRFHQ